MLNGARVHTALPAGDLDRARRFYADRLGLTPTEETADGLRYDCGGRSSFLLFESAISGRGGHTQAGIEVADLTASVAELESRGVGFEDNGSADDQSGSRAAWFKDSEGNLIALVERRS
jgi:catechol 2,3-dioxygenase-like lactoylglutathione lyase family enzyme